MDDLHLFSTQCWQFVDLMRIPVRALQVVQFERGEFALDAGAIDLLRTSQQPLDRFLRLPWRGFTIRLAKNNRERFSVYHRFVEEAFNCPRYIDLTILQGALDVWVERIERDSEEDAFAQHGSATRMLELAAASPEHSIMGSQGCSCLPELQAEFRRLAETVSEMDLLEDVGVDRADSTLAIPRSR